MAIQAGLVGLPNVGKSTLFNALTKSGIPAENYPFCTIDPNIAITNVPDARLDRLSEIFKSQKLIPTTVKFVDIAGLVKGASQGEGLGNQFLTHIMDVDLILHVLRCFEDENVLHVHNIINPFEDFETICAELMLKDLESVVKREERIGGFLKGSKSRQASSQQIKEWETELRYMQQIKAALNDVKVELVQSLAAQAKSEGLQLIQLLSSKNYLIIANLSEEEYLEKTYVNNVKYQNLIKRFGEARVIPTCAKLEGELAQMPDAEADEMLKSLGLEEKGLDQIISKAYSNLGLITFFTCGPKEAHAWSLRKNTKVVNAAGEIHSDLERGFICAEVYNCKDIFEVGSESGLKAAGKLRVEGRDYVVQDGDLLNIRFNV